MGHLFISGLFYFMYMNKFIFLLAVLIGIPSAVFSQLQSNSSATTDFYSQYMVNKRSTDAYDDIEGSPYLNSKFLAGDIHYPQKNYSNINLRYNIYKDEFEFSKNNNSYVLSNADKITFLNVDNNKWVYLELPDLELSGFYNSIGNYDDAVLLKKYNVKYISERPAQSYKPYQKATFSEPEISYYLLFNKTKVVELYLSKRKSPKKLSDKKSELKKFLKESDNDLSTEYELVLFVDYYFSIK